MRHVRLDAWLHEPSASHSTTVAAVQGCLEEADKDRRAKALEQKTAQARVKKLQDDLRTTRSQLAQTRVCDLCSLMLLQACMAVFDPASTVDSPE